MANDESTKGWHHVIEAIGLTKRYGPTTAVDDVTFTVSAGKVTGFLGPNGAGKSTTMRMVVGLDAPSAGSVTVNGKPYAKHHAPLLEVGALLDAKAVHTGRSAFNHLAALAATHGIPTKRVHEVIEMTGLQSVASKRVGGFSLGMGQRLGIAVALLGDPKTLILDEPVNGLDPEGILWFRNLMKHLASEGRTVFVSSHLMSEMAITAENLIVIGRGKLIADCTTEDFIDRSSDKSVLVKSPDAAKLRELITAAGGQVTADDEGNLDVRQLEAPRIGELAARDGLVLYELSPQLASLEEAFMELTRDSLDYGGHGPDGSDPAVVAAACAEGSAL